MKAASPANQNNFEARRRDKVVAVWRDLGEPRVGENELRDIQQALGPEFDASPAAVARMLADEGAQLRHPEVIEFDARWRVARLETEAEKFKELEKFSLDKFISCDHAEAMLNELERLRQQLTGESDREALAELIAFAATARRAAESQAASRSIDSDRRAEQAEIAEWIKVWIQTPGLFAVWLELRKSSPEFRDKFGGE